MTQVAELRIIHLKSRDQHAEQRRAEELAHLSVIKVMTLIDRSHDTIQG